MKYIVTLSFSPKDNNYGIIIVREGLMFVNFVPRIYIPRTIKQSNELRYIVIELTSYPWNYVLTNQQNYENPQTLIGPHE